MNQAEQFYNQLLTISGSYTTYFSLLPVFAACFFWNKLNAPLRLFFWFLVSRLVLNLITVLFIWSANKHYNQFWKPILNFLKIEDTNFFSGIFSLNDIIFIGFFYSILYSNFISKTKIQLITIFLIVFQLFNYFFIDGFRSLGIVGILVSTTYLIVLSALYLLMISKMPPNLPILKNSFFWISLALFIPQIVALFNILVIETLFKSDFILFCKARIFRNVLQMLSELLFIISFWYSSYTKYL